MNSDKNSAHSSEHSQKFGLLNSTRGFRQKLKSVALSSQSNSSRTSRASAFRPSTAVMTHNKVQNRPSSLDIGQRKSRDASKDHHLSTKDQASDNHRQQQHHGMVHERSRSISPVEKLIDKEKEAKRRRKIERARLSRLYLIGRRGPCTFDVVAEEANIKYVVTIDEKPLCSCGKQSCVHLLFVYLRVLRLRSDDPRLFATRLPHYQVTNLICQYESQLKRRHQSKEGGSSRWDQRGRPGVSSSHRSPARRSHSTLAPDHKPRLLTAPTHQLHYQHQHTKAVSDSSTEVNNEGAAKGSSSLVSSGHSLAPPPAVVCDERGRGGGVRTSSNMLRAPIVTLSRESTMSSNQSLDTDGDDLGCCPICLLAMGEGDQVAECQNSCKNKIHSLCLQVWERACHDREEDFTCPLCRCSFTNGASAGGTSSSVHVPSFSDISTPDEDNFIRQSIHQDLSKFSEVLSEDLIDGLSSSDPETVKLALQAAVRQFSNSNSRSQSFRLPSTQHDGGQEVALHVINCVLRLPFTVCNFCAEPLMNLIRICENCSDKVLRPVVEKLFHQMTESHGKNQSDLKAKFVQLIEETYCPLWRLFLELHSGQLLKTLKSQTADVENETLTFETQSLLKYLKFHPWDKIADEAWPRFSATVILPILGAYGHFSKETKPIVKEIVTMTCQFVAKDPNKSDNILQNLAKLGDESVKLGNYVERKIKEQKLKLRLAEQNEVCETIRAEVAEKERRIKSQNSWSDGQNFSDLRVKESDVSQMRPNDINFSEFVETSHWKKGECVGRGGHSLCYVIKALHTGHMMVVKQIRLSDSSASAVDEQRKEFELIRRLQRHPHIVEIFGSNYTDLNFNIYQEWMPGGSVSNHVKHFGPFNSGCLKRLLSQLSSAVEFLHSNRVAHRDIKGDNLLLDLSGTNVKLCDFGTASLISQDGTGPMQFANELVGTVCFMAPEVIRGQPYGRSCDIWSLGCVIIQMAGGSLPWRASQHSNKAALMYQIAMSDVPPPELGSVEAFTYPENTGLRPLTEQCLQLDPSARINAKNLLKHPYFN